MVFNTITSKKDKEYDNPAPAEDLQKNYFEPSVDVIAFNQQLQQFVTHKNKNAHFSYAHDLQKKQEFLQKAEQDLAQVNQLNQPRLHIPLRFNRFPFKFFRFFFRLFIRVHNYINSPQRAINHHLQTSINNHIHILREIIKEQQAHAETRQTILTLQQQINQLSTKLSALQHDSEN